MVENCCSLFLVSFPFLSRPFLKVSSEQAQQTGTHLRLASVAASIGKEYPFPKMRSIFPCWDSPKPFHYIHHRNDEFAKLSAGFFEKILTLATHTINTPCLDNFGAKNMLVPLLNIQSKRAICCMERKNLIATQSNRTYNKIGKSFDTCMLVVVNCTSVSFLLIN